MDAYTKQFVKRCYDEGLNETQTTELLLQDAMNKVASGQPVVSDIAKKFFFEQARTLVPNLLTP